MSIAMSARMNSLTPYVPGEQPRDRRYIKLNTNESPYPPARRVAEAAAREAARLQLYSDPESAELTQAVARLCGVSPRRVLLTNGSDEILNFAVMVFGDAGRGFAFPDVTYGFYPVFCALNGVPFSAIPLREDFSIDPEDYCGLGKNIIIANPNAPTGLTLEPEDIERILRTNPQNLVVIDEAYVDFGGKSCVSLVEKYDNLLITQTFSKSRSLAGARLGFGVGNEALIAALNTIKYSTNPYNVNRMSSAAGLAAIEENGYYMQNARAIAATRDRVRTELLDRGFGVTESRANFLFVRSPFCTGRELYSGLRERGVLIRQWNAPRIENWCRVTVGAETEMAAFLAAVDDMKKEAGK